MKILTKENKRTLKYMLQSVERLRDAAIDEIIQSSVTVASAARDVADAIEQFESVQQDILNYFYD